MPKVIEKQQQSKTKLLFIHPRTSYLSPSQRKDSSESVVAMVTPVTHEKMDDRCSRAYHLVNEHRLTDTHAPFTDASRRMIHALQKLCHPKPHQTLCQSFRGRLHALSATHLSTHLLTFFSSAIFPLKKVIILGVRRVKGDHFPRWQ